METVNTATAADDDVMDYGLDPAEWGAEPSGTDPTLIVVIAEVIS